MEYFKNNWDFKDMYNINSEYYEYTDTLERDIDSARTKIEINKYKTLEEFIDNFSNFIQVGCTTSSFDFLCVAFTRKVNALMKAELKNLDFDSQQVYVSDALNKFRALYQQYKSDVGNTEKKLFSIKSLEAVSIIFFEFHKNIPQNVLDKLQENIKNYWLDNAVMIKELVPRTLMSFWSTYNDGAKNFVRMSKNHINSVNADILYSKEYLNFAKMMPFYVSRDMLLEIMESVDFLNITKEKTHDKSNLFASSFFSNDLFDVSSLSNWAYFFRLLAVINKGDNRNDEREKAIRKVFESYINQNYDNLKGQIKNLDEYDFSFLFKLTHSGSLLWNLFFTRKEWNTKNSEKLNRILVHSMITLCENEKSLRIPSNISFNPVTQNPLWFVISTSNYFLSDSIGDVVIKILKDNDLILGKYKNSKNKSVYDLAIISKLDNLDIIKELTLINEPSFMRKLFSYVVSVNLKNEIIHIPELETVSVINVVKKDDTLPVFLTNLLNEIEMVRKKTETLIEKYIIDDENSDFIRNRINIYLNDVIAHYKEEKNRLEDMKSVNSSEVNRLDVELKNESIENLNILKRQLLIARDKISKEVIEESSFKRQGMSAFLKARFPDAL